MTNLSLRNFRCVYVCNFYKTRRKLCMLHVPTQHLLHVACGLAILLLSTPSLTIPTLAPPKTLSEKNLVGEKDNNRNNLKHDCITTTLYI